MDLFQPNIPEWSQNKLCFRKGNTWLFNKADCEGKKEVIYTLPNESIW